jgi:hypothetical protein
MIRHIALKAEPAKPAISQIEMHFLAQPALRTDALDIADQEHPDHQFRIDRGAADGAVERPEAGPDTGQVDEPVDRAQHVIARHMPIEIELVKQCRLHRPRAHPSSPNPPRFERIESGLHDASNADLFNGICR